MNGACFCHVDVVSFSQKAKKINNNKIKEGSGESSKEEKNRKRKKIKRFRTRVCF